MSINHRRTCTFALLLVKLVVIAAYDPEYEFMTPDMNLLSQHVITASGRCGSRLLRRNGYLYSHQTALDRISSGQDLTNKLYHYPDDINCTLNMFAGLGKQC